LPVLVGASAVVLAAVLPEPVAMLVSLESDPLIEALPGVA